MLPGYTLYRSVSVVHQNPPFTVIDGAPGNQTYQGYLVDLWRAISGALSLSYQMVPLSEGGFGAQLENGTWTGIVGALAENVSEEI